MKPAAATPVAADFRGALERGDDLVQALTVAKYALHAHDLARAADSIDTALAMARRALTDLVETAGSQSVLAASLVRRTSALDPTPTGPADEGSNSIRLTS
jgi:3-oxoacyl-ACP reductase-like protein